MEVGEGEETTHKGLWVMLLSSLQGHSMKVVLRGHPLCRAVDASCWGVAERPVPSGASRVR